MNDHEEKASSRRSPDPLNVACIQLCSGTDVRENVAMAGQLIRRAAAEGARFIATPEMTSLMERRPEALRKMVVEESQDPALAALRTLAAELRVWLLVGSLPIRSATGACVNRSVLISPRGDVAVRYDKIHLFDVDIGDGQTYRESETYAAGDRAIVAELDGVRVGMTVCYDLRFPALFRALAQAGAEIITVPAAFTRVTGEAHWHVLLRARAIENGCYIIAPAQGGRHADGRETYGHSLIIGPWGEILAEGGTEPGVIHATLDLRQVAEARRRIPSLRHDRPFHVAQ